MTNQKISRFGYLRVKAVSPLMEIANVSYNVDIMVEEIKKAHTEQVSVVVFPELGLTGYTCEDLFHQSYLLNNARKGLSRLLTETKYIDMLIAVGLPYQMPDGRLYNTAVILHRGKILGMTLKKYLPNYGEFYEMRYFTSGIDRSYSLEFEGQRFEAGNQIYQLKNPKGRVLATLGVQVCEDIFATIGTEASACLSGANIILNLSASNELVGKINYRKQLLSLSSAKCHSAVVYSSAGSLESTKDIVFGGHCLIYENGNFLDESERFLLDKSGYAIADIDIQKLEKERRQNTTFETSRPTEVYKIVETLHNPETQTLNRYYDKNPFIPSNPEEMETRAEEIIEIQSTGLARTMKGSKHNKIIVGLSGGLDSTWAAIIGVKACQKLRLPVTNFITVSMPCFGTSNRTRQQSKDLATALGTTFMEIDITETAKLHLQDVNHKDDVYDAAYENIQAKIRTNHLFSLANMNNAIVVGTGDLTELSCGFLTTNGDQISGFCVNCSIPKSLIRWLVSYISNKNPNLTDVLNRILKTKISPELLPTKNGADNSQESEKILGNYDVLDFIIYHQIRNGFSKNKIKFLLNQAYMLDSSIHPNVLNKTVDSYFNKFYINQFKRTLAPAGVKVGGVSFSPRGDWRMPDTCSYEDEPEDT